jgi:flagellar FliL protein
MPEDRTTPTPPTDDAAIPTPAPSGGGFLSWLPLIITVVLMPALAFGMTQFVLLPRLQEGLGIKVAASPAAATKAGKSSADEKTISVAMNKILVNVAGTMGARYLLVSLSVAGTGADFKDRMDQHDAQLRDAAGGVLSSKTLADLEKPGERNLIRNELISGFNTVLGDSVIKDIYLTEFAIQ